MKKFAKTLVSIIALLGLVSCGGTSESQNSNSEESVKPSESVSESLDTESNHVSDQGSSDEADTKEDEVAVTFRHNYEGAPADTKVNEIKDQVFSSFPEMTRTGYRFAYWSTDAEGKNAFSFSTIATEGITLYANWIEDNDNAVTVTFHSGEDVYIKMSTTKDGRLKEFPSLKLYKKDHFFKNWYDSEEFTNVVSAAKKYSADTDVYGRWFVIDTFEAEYTKVDGLTKDEDKNINSFGEKIGHGYSSDVSGTGLIFDGSIVNGGASNNHFICDLYYKDAFIQFDFEAEEATEDAILKTYLSAEYFDMTFTKDNWIVEVNGVSIDYPTIVIDNVPTGRDVKMKRAFSEFTLSTALPLNKGKNTIKLITNNSTRHDSTGTMAAEAPMIDCISCYSDTKLTFDAHTENLD